MPALSTRSCNELVRLNLRDDWRKFATALFKIEDADPGYMMLARAKLTEPQKQRYVIAWCTYYNPGIAAIASEKTGADFWRYLVNVYPTAKRASERRHFRGQAGLKALADWSSTWRQPERMFYWCVDGADTYMRVRRNMLDVTQMGEYFYWKMADIADTVFGQPIDFTGCEKYMPKVPKQGAELIASLEKHDYHDFYLNPVMRTVTQHVSKLKHPFAPHRPLALQEAETVCCVFKQHQNKYQLGFRTAKAVTRIESALTEAPKTAKALLDGMWAGGIWTPENVRVVKEQL